MGVYPRAWLQRHQCASDPLTVFLERASQCLTPHDVLRDMNPFPLSLAYLLMSGEQSISYLRNKWFPQELKATIIYLSDVFPCWFSSLETGVVSTVDGCALVT